VGTERLQKILSQCGYGSRRDCEKLIAKNIVTVNGQTAKLGEKANPQTDDIRVNQEKIQFLHTPNTYIILNKPVDVLSDIKDSRGRKKVVDLVDYDAYLFIVGRLDYRSEGLILLTNDGEVANRLTHPRYEHEKEYHVLINKKPAYSQIQKWRNGVVLESGYKTLPANVKIHSALKDEQIWLKIILKEGKKRQIRETGKVLGLNVERIIRTRIGPITLGNLEPGKWRHLSDQEIKDLKKSCSLN